MPITAEALRAAMRTLPMMANGDRFELAGFLYWSDQAKSSYILTIFRALQKAAYANSFQVDGYTLVTGGTHREYILIDTSSLNTIAEATTPLTSVHRRLVDAIISNLSEDLYPCVDGARVARGKSS